VRPAAWLAATALAAFAACDTPGVTMIEPDRASGPDSVTFHVQLEDTALARALGWENGVPGAEVQLHRTIDPFQPHKLYTDSTGHAYLASLFPGMYEIATQRTLTEDESGPTGNLVRAFGDGLKYDIHGRETIHLQLGADHAGSLVISEIYLGGSTQEIPHWVWGQFFELYNNSDTTVYVDGMLWGRGFGYHGSNLAPCEQNQGFREDPAGLWSEEFHQFPGSGRDYPVAPGQTITVALDAVDHSVVHPTLANLSQADFELEGTADTDNPDVPNLPSKSLRGDPRGHGMLMDGGDVLFLTLPVDVGSLATQKHPVSGREWARIPTDRIVDVMHSESVYPNSAPPLPPKYYCFNWVNREFDRLQAPYFRPDPSDNTTSMHRRVLRVTGAGRRILQDVNTSWVDFLLASRSPGRIEY
jgi:hypothetical protein